jgi:hypothetical protein
MERAANEYTHDELLTIAAASMAMVFAVSQDFSTLPAATDELVATQARALYREVTESQAGLEPGEPGWGEEEEQSFTQRFLHYYSRTRETCANDRGRFSLLQGILVGDTLGVDAPYIATSKRLIFAACVPRMRAEMEPTWTGALPDTIDGVEIEPTLRAFWALLETIVTAAPTREPDARAHTPTSPS